MWILFPSEGSWSPALRSLPAACPLLGRLLVLLFVNPRSDDFRSDIAPAVLSLRRRWEDGLCRALYLLHQTQTTFSCSPGWSRVEFVGVWCEWGGKCSWKRDQHESSLATSGDNTLNPVELFTLQDSAQRKKTQQPCPRRWSPGVLQSPTNMLRWIEPEI